MKRLSHLHPHHAQQALSIGTQAQQAVEDSLSEIFDKFTWVVLGELKEFPTESARAADKPQSDARNERKIS